MQAQRMHTHTYIYTYIHTHSMGLYTNNEYMYIYIHTHTQYGPGMPYMPHVRLVGELGEVPNHPSARRQILNPAPAAVSQNTFYLTESYIASQNTFYLTESYIASQNT